LRNAINLLESALLLLWRWELTTEHLIKAWSQQVYYDRDGEEHYNIISAVHKSLRDSDPHAACYWIQRMLVAWEDPLYIARRLLRFASEDIWLADNNALLLANQVYDAVSKVGMPECWIFLMQLAVYLWRAPKSNLVYKIDNQTKADVQKYGNLPVPMHIRNAPTKMMSELGYWKWYKYAHDYPWAKVDQEHFPDKLKWRKYY
jgi:putative ATPase